MLATKMYWKEWWKWVVRWLVCDRRDWMNCTRREWKWKEKVLPETTVMYLHNIMICFHQVKDSEHSKWERTAICPLLYASRSLWSTDTVNDESDSYDAWILTPNDMLISILLTLWYPMIYITCDKECMPIDIVFILLIFMS